jgi:hypothetical protein
MAYLSQIPRADNMSQVAPFAARSAYGLPLAARLMSIAMRVRDYIETMIEHYAAAAIYEQLYRLSDAELHRRGLSRVDLARDVVAARDRA